MSSWDERATALLLEVSEGTNFMEASFAISTHRSNCCEVIKLAGDLDLATDDQLKMVTDHLLVVPDHLIVDVSAVTPLDSTGLRLLHRASALVDGRIWL